MRFVVKMYMILVRERRCFIHEHLAAATSWKQLEVVRLRRLDGLRAVVTDQCEFGLISKDKWGQAPLKNPTRFLTNSRWVAEALHLMCQNEKRDLKTRHRHVHLISGRASKTPVCPRGLCEAMVEGMTRPIEHDELHVVKVKSVTLKTNAEESVPKTGGG